MTVRLLLAGAAFAAALTALPAAAQDPNFNFSFGIGADGKPTFSFGVGQPEPEFNGPTACFFSNNNFKGDFFCAEEGDSYDSLEQWDNRISSFKVFEGARVELCRNEDFDEPCATYSSDRAALNATLNNRVSSLEVFD